MALNPIERYTATARILHWAVAGLIVTQFVLAKLAERADDADQLVRQLGLLANHKSVGITIFSLALLRLAWRLLNPPPALPPETPRWQVSIAGVTHWVLYALLFAMPISGWLMSSAAAYSVSWFGLFQLPDLVGPDPAFRALMEETHELLAKALFVVAGVHILAAIKHAVIDRDSVLARMTGIPTLLLFFVVLAGSVTVLSSPGRSVAPRPTEQTAPSGAPTAPPVATGGAVPGMPARDAQTAAAELADVAPEAAEGEAIGRGAAIADGAQAADPAPMPSPAPPEMLPAPEPALWVIDYAASTIGFTGDQAGASFDGEWTSWQAQIRFSGDNLDASSFAVTVDTDQVDTRDAERDGILADPEWFDSAAYPQAFYRASTFTAMPDGRFVAQGELTIKYNRSPVPLTFTVTTDGNRRLLEAESTSRLLLGEALVNRVEFNLGTGDWQDLDWVGAEVQVRVKVVATVGNP